MEELYSERKIRAISVSNFHPDKLIDLIVHNKVVPAVYQIETHPFQQQRETQNFLQENAVEIQSWVALQRGETIFFKMSIAKHF